MEYGREINLKKIFKSFFFSNFELSLRYLPLQKQPLEIALTLLKKRLEHVLPCEIYEILRTSILKNICKRLLLLPVHTAWNTGSTR